MARHATHGILSWQRQAHQEGAQLPWQLVRWVITATFSQTMLIIACTSKQKLTRFLIPTTVCILVYHVDKRFNISLLAIHPRTIILSWAPSLACLTWDLLSLQSHTEWQQTCASQDSWPNKPMMTPFAQAHVAYFNSPAAVCQECGVASGNWESLITSQASALQLTCRT